jgi:carboxypeptidase Taq
MTTKLEQFKKLLAEYTDLYRANALVGWDQQTYMPRGGAEDRGYVLATLAGVAHEKFTSAEMGNLLDELIPQVKEMDPDSDDACIILRTKHDFDKQTKIPTEKVAEYAQVFTMAEVAWEHAREEKDFNLFKEDLKKIVDLRREYSSYFQPYDHIYDPQLDDFEPGLKTADVVKIFNKLRPQQVALIKAIGEKPQIDSSFLDLKYDEKAQWAFGEEVITRFGFDWNRGRQDSSVHPFTTSFGIGDVRITTHVYPTNATSALFSTMHEGGHALYEQGVSTTLARYPQATGASMAVHESQSRLWENLVGRSMAFWKFFYPKFQQIFSSQLGNVSLDQFYRAINKVQPSFIRTESDEATYNMHIMLRMELEIALLEGAIEVKDLPEAWNARMKEYLGVVPPDDRMGVLQDVHWSSGLMGYFPTYALGNLISAQLWEKIESDIPTLDQQIESGKFDELLGWLRGNIHRHGAKFEPQVLVKRVTGSEIDPEPYMRYLNKKYGEIYSL